MNKRKRGEYYETIAAEKLVLIGCCILKKNYRCKYGEIDIIAKDGKTLAFVEVKYRASGSAGYPEEAVSFYKQKRICLTADYYRVTNGISDDIDCRFDVIAIDNNGIRHYKNAFPYLGRG